MSLTLDKDSLELVLKQFKKIPAEFTVRRKMNILKKGMEPFLMKARQLAPVDTGATKESIGTKKFKNNNQYLFGGVLRSKKVAYGSQKQKLDPFYAKFAEGGFRHIAWPEKGRRIKNGYYGANRIKQIPARPFIEPAWRKSEKDVFKTTVELTEKIIDKIYK